ncbi:hypothetical protein [uncultured Helicobacter sp.]|uniref:hypothetical protein n=1 Tax=uncultured Helicobacter sp. TaxID=175537 RepID=UPI001C3A6B52|nr:hypothetical protein [Candidatus Helicobacter avicola]
MSDKCGSNAKDRGSLPLKVTPLVFCLQPTFFISNPRMPGKPCAESRVDSKVQNLKPFRQNLIKALPEILVSCVRFKCCAKRGAGSYLSGSDQAEMLHSFKDCTRDEFLKF